MGTSQRHRSYCFFFDLVLKCGQPTKHQIASLSHILTRSGIITSETDLWYSIIFAFFGGFVFGLFELSKMEFDEPFITITFGCLLIGVISALLVGVPMTILKGIIFAHSWIAGILVLIIACSVYFE